MARVVYKYPLVCSPHRRRCEVLLPTGSKILHIDKQRDDVVANRLFIWAETNPDWEASEAPPATRRIFEIYGTGWEIDEVPNSELHHCKTVFDGPFVWHIYERVYDAGHEPQGTPA